MPEGDTIFRAAQTLQRALAGHAVTRFETVLAHLARVHDDAPITGRTIESVRSSGKWLLIEFSGGLTLLTHMRMSGSWHIYRPGEPWRQTRSNMRIVIATDKIVAVAFSVPVAEFHTPRTLAHREGFNRLGPDLLSTEFDDEAALGRLQSRPDAELGIALLTQSLMAGLGNVFKSEACFAARLNPFRTVGSLSQTELRDVVTIAKKLIRSNVVGAYPMRRTTGRTNLSERLWVYKRAGQPCRICGTAIESRKQGIEARPTFWCPLCQPSKENMPR